MSTCLFAVRSHILNPVSSCTISQSTPIIAVSFSCQVFASCFWTKVTGLLAIYFDKTVAAPFRFKINAKSVLILAVCQKKKQYIVESEDKKLFLAQ